METNLKSTSKFLSYVLRHHPEEIGLTVNENGWASVDELLDKARKYGKNIDRKLLEKLIEEGGGKKRFTFSEDQQYVRATYGHSIKVDLQLNPKTPPKVLYHGTAEKNLSSIIEKGLNAQSRNFVHLSVIEYDAHEVGSRHGSVAILAVESGIMHRDGYVFYQSESEPGIWLTKEVPPKFLNKL
ncbi:RNA 2'-phosphotransferase [Fodinibius salicampi]|uniref:RNA 2'-phosphotransferase n=1 Tax=Fodinibius salicampi TaxID=1920655 RepID=UPI0022453054|nr:RNA 2'-phosphotransferase [Fodinibius salicampi]